MGGWGYCGDCASAAVVAVVPILPAFQALAAIVSVLLLSAATAAAAWFRPKAALAVMRLVWRQKLALVVLTLLATAGLWSVHWARDHWRYLPPPRADGGIEWPMHRGGLRRLGAAPDAVGPDVGGLAWSFGRRGAAFYSSAVVVNGRVFVVGSTGDRGRIYCLDAASGQLVWSCAPRSYRATFSSPVIVKDFLICGEGLHHTRAARLVCVDLRRGREGQVAWTFATNGHVECTPAIEGHRIYFGAGDDGVYCLELGENAPKVVWRLAGRDYPDAETSLAVHDGCVYVGLGVGGNALCKLNAADGVELKRLSLPFPVFSPPSIFAGKLYVGMGVGDYITPEATPAGQVCCVDLKTLQTLWAFPTRGTVLGAIAVDNGELIFGCADGRVYVLDEHGKQQRNWDSRSPIVASVAVTRERIYAVNQAGILTALDRRWLEPVWEHRFTVGGRFVSSPTVAEGSVFIGTENDGCVRLGEHRPSTTEPIWPGSLGGPGAAGNPHGSALPPVGKVLWTFPGDEMAAEGVWRVLAPVAASGEAIVVPIASGLRRGLARLDDNHGEDRPRLRWFAATGDGVRQSPAIASDKVVAVRGGPGDSGRSLVCLALDSGDELWRHPVQTDASGEFLADGQGVVIQDEARRLSAIALSGGVAWSRDIGQTTGSVCVQRSLLVGAIGQPPALIAMDRPTGRLLWKTRLEASPTTSPILMRDRVYVGRRSGLEIRSLLDGSRIAELPDTGGVAGPIYVDERRYALINEAGRLVIGGVSGASAAMRFEGATAGMNPLVAGSSVLFPASGKLMGFSLTDVSPQPTEWLDLAPFGGLTSAPVLHRGRVYVGVQSKGLACAGEGRGR